MQVNMHEAKSQLSRLGRLAWEGEEVVIAKAGQPYLRLEPYSKSAGKRTLGVWAGQVEMAPDFDETPPEVVDAFYGSSVLPSEDG